MGDGDKINLHNVRIPGPYVLGLHALAAAGCTVHEGTRFVAARRPWPHALYCGHRPGVAGARLLVRHGPAGGQVVALAQGNAAVWIVQEQGVGDGGAFRCRAVGVTPLLVRGARAIIIADDGLPRVGRAGVAVIARIVAPPRAVTGERIIAWRAIVAVAGAAT